MLARIVVLWNPNSGKAASAAAIRDDLERRPDSDVIEVTEPSEVAAQIEAAVVGGADRIYIAGGDGTVSAAAGRLMRLQSRVPLGIIPLGTGNDFCRTLAIPLDPTKAVASLDAAIARPIDVIQMADGAETHHFLNMASSGNSDRVIDQMTDEQKQWWGPLAYLRGALDVASDLITYKISVTDDDGLMETFDIWNLMLANGRMSGGGITVAPLARPDDGKIDLVIVRTGTLPDMVEASVRLFMETLLESNLVEHRQAARFRIDSEPSLRFTADGDLVEWAPIDFRVCPGAISMLVGPDFEITVKGDAPAVH